ncbi:hypothetical protein CPB86DRAFT_792854 [Serendipita vermifera]|nr:hypothetical protein CPB86DRAFT_792854 [Serendipita vermifera]
MSFIQRSISGKSPLARASCSGPEVFDKYSVDENFGKHTHLSELCAMFDKGILWQFYGLDPDTPYFQDVPQLRCYFNPLCVSISTNIRTICTATYNGECAGYSTVTNKATFEWFGWAGTVNVTTMVPGKTTYTTYYPTATIGIPTPCPTCEPTTLYDTSVFTTSVPTTFVTTSSIPPYAQYSTRYETDASGFTTSTIAYTFDWMYGRKITTTVTRVVPITSTRTIPTATISTPCVTKRAEEIEAIEKREVEPESLLERAEEERRVNIMCQIDLMLMGNVPLSTPAITISVMMTLGTYG